MDEQKTLLEVAVTTAAGRAEVQSLKRELQELKGEQQALNSEAYDQRASIFTGSGGADTTPAAGGDNGVERVSMLAGAHEELAEASGKAAEGQKALAEAGDKSTQQNRALLAILSRINPELAGMAQMLGAAERAGEMLFSPIAGLALGAAAAFKVVNDVLMESVQRSKEVLDQMGRIKAARLETTAMVAGELAKRGIGSAEDYDKGSAVAARLGDRGFERGAAAQTAAAAVAGGIDEKDLDLWAAAAQTGQIDLGGKTPGEQAAKLRQAASFVERNRDRLAQSAAALTRGRKREIAGAAGDDAQSAEQIAISELGMTPEQARQAAADLHEREQEGLQPGDYEGFSDEGLFGDIGTDASAFFRGFLGSYGGQTRRQDRIDAANRLRDAIAGVQRRAQTAAQPANAPATQPAASPKPAAPAKQVGGVTINLNGGTANFPTGFRKQTVPRVGAGR